MADYYAHYTTRWLKPDGARGNAWTDIYPVIGYTDVALVVDNDGSVLTVEALREVLAKGGDTPDADGETFTVHFEVSTFAGSDE